MRAIPTELLNGPFTRREALAHGVTSRMLQGDRFVWLFPRVFRASTFEMDDAAWRRAARLAMPSDAHLTGVSRIQELGLDLGPTRPVRFVVARDHHRRTPGVYLHRTISMPPLDDVGVTPAAAFLAYCGLSRVVDAIRVGDWLLHHGHMSSDEVEDLASSALWRMGAYEALWILDHLDGTSRSLPESETRAVLSFAGLPAATVNGALDLAGDAQAIGDLLFEPYRVVVEYDGRQHLRDTEQYERDIDRYALLRAHGYRYVQVTAPRLSRPHILVGDVYRALTAGGYAGPPPQFGERWRTLRIPLRAAVGPRATWGRSA